MEIVKHEVECFCKLFPLILHNANEFFCLPDELITTLESSIEKQVEENTLYQCYSVYFYNFYKKIKLSLLLLACCN